MQKERVIVVSSVIDDTIKDSSIYEFILFKDFIRFEEYVQTTPVVVDTIIISGAELPFTSMNMDKLFSVLSTTFLKLNGNCLYLIDNNTYKDVVINFFEENHMSMLKVYQGDLTHKFIEEIILGSLRKADEDAKEIVTYRIRASEYTREELTKRYESDEGYYATDEELLNGIPPIEEPVVEVPSVDIVSNIYYVVGSRSYERTLFAFIEAQYLALTGKTLIVESDVEYHRLTDIAERSTVDHELIYMDDFMTNPTAVINKIKSSVCKLIILGAKNRIYYDYDFVMDILFSNLVGWVDYLVKECDYAQTPYGQYYTIVCRDTVPDIIECCNSLRYTVDSNKVIMVGVRTSERTECDVSSQEMTDIVRVCLDNQKAQAEVVQAIGINLKGDGVTYDVLSLITRGNSRQN